MVMATMLAGGAAPGGFLPALQSALADLAGDWAGSVWWDVSRYVVFAVGVWLIICVALRGVLAARKIRPDYPSRAQMLTEFAISVRSIAIYATVGLITDYGARAGLYPLADMAERWGVVWFVFSLIVMIIAHDAYFYWAHRIMHDRRLFARFHRRHHRSHNPSPFTAYSFDLREAVVMVMFVVVWMAITPTPWSVMPLFMAHQLLRNTLGHCGYELMPAGRNGRPLLDFLTTTTHHDLHHARYGCNYGLYFTWWDRWMGTEHPEYHAAYARAVRIPPPMAAQSAQSAQGAD